MSGRLAGKTALVTAAAQGIGRATAIAMAREGARVLATDIDADALALLPGIDNLTTKRLDVLDDAALAATIDALPPLQILFNCAGWVQQGTILECSPADWDTSFHLNVRSMYVAIRAALPKMLAHFDSAGIGASIVNMASVASSVRGLPNRFAYGASKAAVIGLTKSVAADYVRSGIRCNAVAPGTVDTPSLAQRIAAHADPIEARRMFVARQPMGRLATADEIAPLVVFLASDEAAFITGNICSCDGGMTL